jgi:hypothetical protein
VTETLGVKSTDTPHATIYVSSEEEENAFTDGHAPVLIHSNDAVRRERRGNRPREEEGKKQDCEEGGEEEGVFASSSWSRKRRRRRQCLPLEEDADEEEAVSASGGGGGGRSSVLSARNRTESRGSENTDESSVCARSEDTQGESRHPHVERPPHVEHPPSSHEKSLCAHEGRLQQQKVLDARNAHACPRALTKEAAHSNAWGYPDARRESGRESGRVCVGRGERALEQGHPSFHSKKWTKPVTEAVEGGAKALKPQVREAPEAAAEGRAQEPPVRQAPQAAAEAKESQPLGTPPGRIHRIL